MQHLRNRQFSIETHPTTTTLYLRGVLDIRLVLAALRACDALPTDVRAMRVDLMAATADARVLDALAVLVTEWLAGRAERAPRRRVAVARGAGDGRTRPDAVAS